MQKLASKSLRTLSQDLNPFLKIIGFTSLFFPSLLSAKLSSFIFFFSFLIEAINCPQISLRLHPKVCLGSPSDRHKKTFLAFANLSPPWASEGEDFVKPAEHSFPCDLVVS